MAVAIQQDILRFQVPVQNALLQVQIPQDHYQLSRVKSGQSQAKASVPPEVEKEISPSAIFGKEIEL